MSSETMPDWEPENPRGSNNKLLIGLGIGCGGLLLLCCGGLTFSGYWVQNWAENAFSDDPVVVRENAEEIASINLPEVFQPQGSMDMKIPFANKSFMKMVIFASEDQQSTFVMAEFDGEMFGEDQQDEMSRQIKQSLDQKGQNQQQISVEESEQLNLTVRGQPASFVLERGIEQDSQAEMWQVRGTFQGKRGIAFLILMVPTDQMSREEVIEMLESIE